MVGIGETPLLIISLSPCSLMYGSIHELICELSYVHMLVYEYMINGTVRYHLSGKFFPPFLCSYIIHFSMSMLQCQVYVKDERNILSLTWNFQLKPLDFSLRLRIALGSARGILYLHNEANPPIFHHDIKARNILLDDKFNARVADFGLSKLVSLPDMEGSAPDHVSIADW